MKMQSWAKILSIFLAGVHEHHFSPWPGVGMLGGVVLLWLGWGGPWSLGALAVGLKNVEQ